jgi:hypothetical protein
MSDWQPQYLPGMVQAYREAEKAREKQTELQKKAKSKNHVAMTKRT